MPPHPSALSLIWAKYLKKKRIAASKRSFASIAEGLTIRPRNAASRNHSSSQINQVAQVNHVKISAHVQRSHRKSYMKKHQKNIRLRWQPYPTIHSPSSQFHVLIQYQSMRI